MKDFFRINLSTPIAGQIIFEAVRQVTGNEFHHTMSYEGPLGKVYEIGQKSSEPHKNFLIGVGRATTLEVSMGEYYREIHIVPWAYPDEQSSPDFMKSKNKAALLLRGKLQNILKHKRR